MSCVREPDPARERDAVNATGSLEALAWSTLDGQAGAAVIVVDAEFRVKACVGSALTRMGFDPSATVGRPLRDALPAATAEVLERHCLEAMAGRASSAEFETVGRERVYATEFSPQRDEDGTVIGAIAVARDVTQLRHAQDALDDSERQFREFEELATDMQARLSPDGVFLSVSQASKRILGFSPEDLVGTSLHELMHPDDLAKSHDRRAVLDRAHDPRRYEARLRHRDGSWRWCQSLVRLVRSQQGEKALEARCSIRDITERRENEERRWVWEQTFNGTTQGICVIDVDSLVIESVNPAFARMHGGTVAEFVGQPGSALLPPHAHATLPEKLLRIARDDFVRLESEHVRRDGSSFPVRAEVLTVKDTQEQLGGWSSSAGRRIRIAWFEDLTEQRAEEAKRREATELFETAFSRAPMGMALIGLDGRFVRVNSALCEMLGRPEEELVGSTSRRFTHPDDLQVTADAFVHLQTTGAPLSVEKRYLRPDGQVVWAATRGTAVSGADGRPTHIVSHFNDITAVKLAEQRHAEATARFETAFADAPIGMALVALDGRWLKVNRMLCQLSGYTAGQLLTLTRQELTHPDDRGADLEQLEQLLAGEINRYTVQQRYVTAGGEVIWTNLAVSLVRDADGQPMHLIAQLEDISERKRLEAQLQRLADHDPLTELWNRRRFKEQLENQLARCRRYGEQASLLMIDLDGFKDINDTFGHETGDDMLRTIAETLRTHVRATDSLARLGGDEFAIILTNLTPEQAISRAAALRECIRIATIRVGDTAVNVSASIGVEHLDQSTPSDQHALAQADISMYQAKATHYGRARSMPLTAA